MTVTKELNRKFKRAAQSALAAWKGRFNRDELDDLIGDLWQWYLESPAVSRKLDDADDSEFQTLSRIKAIRILSKETHDYNVFAGMVMYSSEAVKAALSGDPKHKYLMTILPEAMSRLVDRHGAYADALTSRYGEGKIPATKSEQNKLVRAHAALTEEVNIIALSARSKFHEGPGSRKKIVLREDEDDFGNEAGYIEVDETPEGGGGLDPDTIRGKGTHGDPTGNLAIMLIDNPSIRDESLYETPIRQFLEGAGYEQPA